MTRSPWPLRLKFRLTFTLAGILPTVICLAAATRGDAARMNRLVEQLLRVARLDAVPPLQDVVELNAQAATVRGLAPWAIGQNA
jgi:hypothetical protein